MKFHIHVYELKSKIEFDVEAENGEKAAEIALKKAKSGEGEKIAPEKQFMALWY